MRRNYIGKRKKGGGGLIFFCIAAFALTFVISILANSGPYNIGMKKQNDTDTVSELDKLFASNNEDEPPQITNAKPYEPPKPSIVDKEEEPPEIQVSATPEKAIVPIPGGSIIKGYSKEVEYSTVYEDWRSHTAVDISGIKGEEVFAIADGVVVESYMESTCGGILKIDHGTFYSVYTGLNPETMEMNGTAIKAGDSIGLLEGEIMGEMADTHLHFEIIENDVYIDPMKYIG